MVSTLRADPLTVPMIEHRGTIEVRTPADAAFAVIARDILAVADDPDAMMRHRPLVEGPLREGFRWEQTMVHDRRLCRTEWVVTEFKPPWLLVQTMEHRCAVSGREGRGGERWELEAGGDGQTVVKLRASQLSPGLRGWLEKVLRSGSGNAGALSVKRRLAVVQFESERHADAAGQSPVQ